MIMRLMFPIAQIKCGVAALFVFLAAVFSAQGLTITYQFDPSITNDPKAATIENTILSAIAIYEFNYSDNVTVAITFQEVTTGLGGSNTYGGYYNYADYRHELDAQRTTDDDDAAFYSLPISTNNPVTNDPTVRLDLPLSRALTFGAPLSADHDGNLTVKTSVIVVPDEPATNRSAVRQFYSRETTHHLAGKYSTDGNPPAGEPAGKISLN